MHTSCWLSLAGVLMYSACLTSIRIYSVATIRLTLAITHTNTHIFNKFIHMARAFTNTLSMSL